MSADVLPFTASAPKRTYGRLVLDHASQTWRLTGLEPHVVLRLKNTFPKVPKTETKGFGFRHTPENCADLDWFMVRYPMAMSEADRRALKGGKHSFDTNLDAIETILLPNWQPPAIAGFKEGFAPYDYQAAAIQIARLRGRLLLGDDLGLGKTVSALGAITDPTFLPAAIVVQPHLAMQWNAFVKKFTTLRPHIIAGTKPYPLPEADVYIFRYSNIAGWIDIAAKAPFKSVIYDEIQDLRGGVRTGKGKAAEVFSAGATALRMGLSGTPVYNYGGEIFHVAELIEPGCLGTWEEFCREWCTSKGMGKWVVKDPDALGTYLREQHLLLRRVRSGRPVNTIIRQVEYDQDVAAKAEDFARALAIKVVEAPSFTERGQAARELDIYARMITGVAKARYVAAVVRILLDAGEPVLLAGWHRDVYEIWNEELKAYRPVMYTGSESDTQKARAKARFCDGDTNLMIISLRSGAGLDGLQHRCSTVVFGELDWSPKVHEQVVGRLDRPGQQEQVTAIYLHADDGSDPLIINMLGLKASQSRGITDPLAGIEHVYSDESRLKLLAEQYLARGSAASNPGSAG
ncbi:DEAD/DEAH box helicase [Methylobacterium fujisawaense]|uniref:DEAD/DEAH box helicase n=1 Tax=Methylobacterium fujisawaense TaxID=107400 RepID=UPI002F334DCA